MTDREVLEKHLAMYKELYQVSLALFGEAHETTIVNKVAANVLLELKNVIEHQKDREDGSK